MNLKTLSDTQLIESTDQAVAREREALTSVLHHLREVERRRLFSAMKFKSLFEYAVKRLHYSENEAYRRISAMRLLKEMPEFESKIESGALSLTNLSLAQSAAKHGLDKRELLAKFEDKSTREAERIVAIQAPQVLVRDTTRVVTEDLVEIKLVANKNLQEKLDRVKGKLAHSHPNATLAQILEYLCDRELELKPVKRSTCAPKKTRVITRGMRAKLGDACENCGSTYALQADHIIPFAKGGETSLENLRILCRNCNQRAAIESFGQETMQPYLR